MLFISQSKTPSSVWLGDRFLVSLICRPTGQKDLGELHRIIKRVEDFGIAIDTFNDVRFKSVRCARDATRKILQMNLKKRKKAHLPTENCFTMKTSRRVSKKKIRLRDEFLSRRKVGGTH